MPDANEELARLRDENERLFVVILRTARWFDRAAERCGERGFGGTAEALRLNAKALRDSVLPFIPKGAAMVAGLQQLINVAKSGEPIEDHFTVREVRRPPADDR